MNTVSTSINPQSIASAWNRRGFSCELWEDVPGHEWSDCIHETDELFLVLEGEIEVEMNGEIIHPEIGEELVIPAETVHIVRNAGIAPTRWLHGCWMDFAQTD